MTSLYYAQVKGENETKSDKLHDNTTNSQNFRTMDMRIALFSPVWAIRNKNRILADPPLTMPVTSACTRAICRGYRADGPGDEVGG